MSPHGYIGAKVSATNALRNRICHWDNLLTVNVAARYHDMLAIVGTISSSGLVRMREQTEHEMADIIAARPIWLWVRHPQPAVTTPQDTLKGGCTMPMIQTSQLA